MLRIARNLLLPGIKPVFLTLNFTDSILNFSYNSITFFSIKSVQVSFSQFRERRSKLVPLSPGVCFGEDAHFSFPATLVRLKTEE